PFALINPGAAWPNKRWPPERFGEIAAVLREVRGLASVVVWGPGEEALAAAVVQASQGAASIAPPTGLAQLVRLSRAPAFVVGGGGGHGSASRRRRGRNPCRRSLRADRPGEKRTLASGRRDGVALRRVPLPLRAPLPSGRLVPRPDCGRRGHRRHPARRPQRT